MQFCALSTVKQRIALGVPLPFNVRDSDRTLLLARGQVITTMQQLNELLERGALVDLDELKRPGTDILEAAAETLPALWGKCADRLTLVLRNPSQLDFLAALDEASKPVLSLVERDPDLAIFQVVRQDVSGMRYGVMHSLHTGIACHLAAQRLGWDRDRRQVLLRAALTMNLAMLELQGRLATQATPPTPAQRAIIQHHRRAAPTCCKPPVSVIAIGWTPSPSTTRTAAIVKEFGIYPPGCCVRLASGEVGLVVKRGETANTPIVAALVNRQGEQMMEPMRRHTAMAEHAIVEVVSEKNLRVRVSPERLALLGA
jgi:hypothetical protein